DFDCLAEHYLLNPGGGAAGVIGAARSVSASLVAAYNQGIYRQLFQFHVSHLAPLLNATRLERVSFAELDGGDRWVQLCLTTLGDPEMPIFTGPVVHVAVAHAPSVTVGPTTLPVQVTSGGAAFENATVCASKGSEVYAVGTTDANGQAVLDFAP